jgi:acetylornithine deacetylase
MNKTSNDSVVSLLSRLVGCPSVNPNGRPVEGPPFGEERMVELLGGLLKEWGAEVRVQEAMPRRANLIAFFKGKRSGRSLMLEAHSDTVQVADMTIPPFEPRVADGKLYGRGACDDKGPMASMLLGIKQVLDRDGRPPVDLYFVSTCNEERGANGAAALMAEGFRADAAVVAEPTDLAIIRAHKGALRWRVKTHGVSAHSSVPERGVNAITMMMRLVDRIQGPIAASAARKNHPLLGHPTISVGTIHGGTAINVIPALCEIEIDRRIIPGETQKEATAELTRHLEELRAEDARFKYSYEQIEWYAPLEENIASPVARAAEAACRRVMGKAEFAVAPWGANTGEFKQAGIPCVLFGPGSIRQAHTADEFIEIAQVATAAEVYAEIIRAFGE